MQNIRAARVINNNIIKSCSMQTGYANISNMNNIRRGRKSSTFMTRHSRRTAIVFAPEHTKPPYRPKKATFL